MNNIHFATLKRFINFRIYWIMHDALKFSNLLPLSFHHFHFKDIFSHENGNHKIEYTISTWHTELESSCRSCVRLKPLQFETTHYFLKMDDDIARSLNEPITTFLFLFCSREMIPCTTQGQDGIMSCQVWLRYVLHYSILTFFYDIQWKNFIKSNVESKLLSLKIFYIYVFKIFHNSKKTKNVSYCF